MDEEYAGMTDEELIGQISHLAGLVENREFGQGPQAQAEAEVRMMLAEAEREADRRGL